MTEAKLDEMFETIAQTMEYAMTLEKRIEDLEDLEDKVMHLQNTLHLS